MTMEKIAVITSGFLPVPATKGGAVETLCENFICQNEIFNKVSLTFFSTYEESAAEKSKQYKNTNFIFIKPNFMVKMIDKVIFFISKKILRKQNSHSYRYIFQRLHFNYKVSKFLKKNNYDKVLLENHTILYLSLKWRKNYMKYKDNYYYHCHNIVPSKFHCDEIIENTKNIICVSEYRKKAFRKDMNLPNTNFSVVLNSIDSSNINKKITKKEQKELYDKYGIKKEDKILVFTGRFVPGKGIEEIIKALKIIKSKNVKLFIIGASLNALNVKNNFENKVLEECKKLRDKVIFTGFIDYNELYKYYSIANVAILPSIIEDSAPLTIIEAISCGLPIITTDSGGIPEYVNDKCAVIIKRDNKISNNIAKSIDKIINDEKILNKMSTESTKLAKRLNLENYYFNLLNEMGIE